MTATVSDTATGRRTWVAAIVVLVLVAAGVTGWALSSRGSSEAVPPPCVLPSVAPKPTATTAPDGGGLRVVESGFTQAYGGQGSKVSIGAIVENTSALIAYDTRIRFAVYDAAHLSVGLPITAEGLYLVIPVIMPGERIGVGTWTSVLSSQPGTGRYVTVVSVDAQLSAAQWWSPADRVFEAVPTTHDGMIRDRAGDGGTMQYTATSPYCQVVADRGVATVFRDHAGKIVGGNFFWPSERDCQPGRSTRTVGTFVEIPPNIDEELTREYLYCDPTRRRPYPERTNGDDPFNV